MKRTRFVLCLMLLVFVSCFVLQGNSNEDICHILCQGIERCKTSLIGNSCYAKFEGARRNWSWAENWCRNYKMEMVNLPNESEASVIAELMKFVGSNNTWLGGRTVDLQKWTFVNGNLLNTGEFPLFQYITSSQSCGVVKQTYQNGQRYTDLELRSCNIELPYFCRSESSLHHAVYQPLTTTKNWFGARQVCRDTGGDLFYAKEGEVVDVLMSNFTKVEKKNVTGVFFIGLRHTQWEWLDGREVTNSNWNSNDHSSQSYRKDCLMLKDGNLSADGCFKENQVICQKEFQKSTDITTSVPTITEIMTQTIETEHLASSEATTQLQEDKPKLPKSTDITQAAPPTYQTTETVKRKLNFPEASQPTNRVLGQVIGWKIWTIIILGSVIGIAMFIGVVRRFYTYRQRNSVHIEQPPAELQPAEQQPTELSPNDHPANMEGESHQYFEIGYEFFRRGSANDRHAYAEVQVTDRVEHPYSYVHAHSHDIPQQRPIELPATEQSAAPLSAPVEESLHYCEVGYEMLRRRQCIQPGTYVAMNANDGTVNTYVAMNANDTTEEHDANMEV